MLLSLKGASLESANQAWMKAWQVEKMPKCPMLPTYSVELKGGNEVRIKNPNPFAVTAGVRAGKSGADLEVPPLGKRSLHIPDGHFDIYFVYSYKPDALFQGDSFTLSNNGLEIQIVKVVDGNYGIKRVK